MLLGVIAASVRKVNRQVLWTPLNLSVAPKIILDDESSINNVSGTASVWYDRSGNAYDFTQSNSSNRPLIVEGELNGKRVLRFDGVNDKLLHSGAGADVFRNTGAGWSFTLYRKRSSTTPTSSAVVFYCGIDGSTVNRFNVVASRASNPGYGAFAARRLTDATAAVDRTTSDINAWVMRLDIADWTNGDVFLWANGVLDSSDTTTMTSGNTADTAGPGLVIASGGTATVTDTQSYSDIDAAVVIVGSGAIPSTYEIDRLFGWAAHQYGLTDMLPTNHPYKLEPPYVLEDPYWDNVVSLLHFDGDVTDETSKVWTVRGGAAPSSEEFAFGRSSLSVPGGTRSGLTYPRSADFALATDDFTIECYAYFLDDANRVMIEIGTGTGWYGRFWMDRYQGKLRIAGGPSISTWIHNGHIPLNSWVHIAGSIQAGQLSGFVNGVLVGTADVSGQLPTGDLSVGIGLVLPQTNPANMYGYIDEVRITKGVARYTENFIPPTAPFPNFGPPIIEPAPEIYSATFTMVPGDNSGFGPLGYEDPHNGSITPKTALFGDVEVFMYSIRWYDNSTQRIEVDIDNLVGADSIVFDIDGTEYPLTWEFSGYGCHGELFYVTPAPYALGVASTVTITVTNPIGI